MAYTKDYEKKTLTEKRDEFLEDLRVKILTKMEEAVKYERAWIVMNQLPYNPITGTKYQGNNAINLLSSGYSDPRWLTFKGIQEASQRDKAEYRLRKGSKAETVLIYTPFAEKDENGNIRRDSEGKTIWARHENGEMKLTMNIFKVFNASQIDGYPKLEVNDLKAHERFAPAEQLIEAMKKDGVDFQAGEFNQAYYSPKQDAVRMPALERFTSPEAYYRTAIHELSHATGHEKRLNRDQTGSMYAGGQKLESYAFEELVAELSSYYTGASIGVPYNSDVHENHAGYLKSWISVLSDKEKGAEFFNNASKLAKSSCTYQLDKLEKSLTIEVEKDLKQEIKTEVPVQTVEQERNVRIIPPKKTQKVSMHI